MNWPADKTEFFKELGQLAHEHGVNLYLVGGAVRDLFLKRETLDIDLMVEGDAVKFVERLMARWAKLFAYIGEPKTPTIFAKFGTVKVDFHGIDVNWLWNLDFCSARQEKYATPGAQPTVSAGTLANDMARRDFSINALAISLQPDTFGSIIDYFNGMDHLRKKVIHILHERSFFDDPARILRAYRYATRLEFFFSPETQEQLNVAIENNALANLPRFRLFDEWRKLLSEDCAQQIIERLQEAKVLEQISPLFSYESSRFSQVAGGVWQQKLACLYEQRGIAEIETELSSFGLKGKPLEAIIAYLR
ncbi:MAG: CCA tRNA nucleotidyltransferase [Deltaproteobacteria bacterium]|nr:CCA tRNA nucleotidyltransferase [Deltaproteobacteria bacterium]